MDNFIPRSYYYEVEISGMKMTFSEVSGLQSELVTEDLAVGGRNDHVFKLPVRVKHQNLVLKRAFNVSLKEDGQVEKTTGFYNDVISPLLHKEGNLDNKNIYNVCRIITITLIDPDGTSLMSWTVNNAYPVKWQLSNLNARENTVAIESIEFAYLFLQMNIS